LAKRLAKLSRVALQIIQIVLAIGSVAAFASLQLGFSQPHDASFLTTNLICSGGLVVVAILTFQLGFVITNGLWVVVSASSLVILARRRRKA
jgi:hypothetical protein